MGGDAVMRGCGDGLWGMGGVINGLRMGSGGMFKIQRGARL